MSTTLFALKPKPTLNLTNISYVVLIKLDRTSYLVCKTLILEHKGLLLIVNGDKSCPYQYVQDESNGLLTLNHNYLYWIWKDQHVMVMINGMLTKSLLPYIVGMKSSKDTWLNLQKRPASMGACHVLQMEFQLQRSKKGNITSKVQPSWFLLYMYLQVTRVWVVATTLAGNFGNNVVVQFTWKL